MLALSISTESHADITGIEAISGIAIKDTCSTRENFVEDATETFLCVHAACPKR